MRVLLFTNPSAGRYPRWGYLDKFGVHPYLARAFFAAVGLQLGVWALVAMWSALHHERQVTVTSVTLLGDVSNPLPPPSIIPPPKNTRPSVGPIPPPQPGHIVPDASADADAIVDRSPTGGAGSGDGTKGGGGGPGNDPSGRYSGPIDFEPSVAVPEAFVAFEQAPELVRMEAPEYPDLARDAGVEGRVNVLVRVGVDGFVREALLADDGVPMLNEAALSAARTAVFKPALQSDRPVQAWIVIPIEFDLRR